MVRWKLRIYSADDDHLIHEANFKTLREISRFFDIDNPADLAHFLYKHYRDPRKPIEIMNRRFGCHFTVERVRPNLPAALLEYQ